MTEKSSKINKNIKKKTKQRIVERDTKVCLICEKPHKLKTKLCSSCNNRSIAVARKLQLYNKYNHGSKLSIGKVMWLKEKYKEEDVLSMIENFPHLYFKSSNRSDYKREKNVARENIKKNYHDIDQFEKYQKHIPHYIVDLFNNKSTKTLITIDGDKGNPTVYYTCELCNEEQAQLYTDIRLDKGHDCKSFKSTGEYIVEEYLSHICEYNTQYKTLKCINPLTNHQLPYDIEVIGEKILIEIQGDQHYKFIEYFHGTKENFEYQQYKDKYKKEFAENLGYTMIYLSYPEIENGDFKIKLDKILHNRQ